MIGKLVTGGAKLIGGIASAVKQNKARKEAEAKAEEQNMLAQSLDLRMANYNGSPVYQSLYDNTLYAQSGALVPPGMPQGPNSELEGGETFQPPMGPPQAVPEGAPSHAQGGVPLNLSSGTMIFSDKLKVPGTKKTFAEEHKKLEKKKDRYQKKLDDPQTTRVSKRTAQRNLDNLTKQVNALFLKQQALNGNDQGQGPTRPPAQFEMGGAADAFPAGNGLMNQMAMQEDMATMGSAAQGYAQNAMAQSMKAAQLGSSMKGSLGAMAGGLKDIGKVGGKAGWFGDKFPRGGYKTKFGIDRKYGNDPSLIWKDVQRNWSSNIDALGKVWDWATDWGDEEEVKAPTKKSTQTTQTGMPAYPVYGGGYDEDIVLDTVPKYSEQKTTTEPEATGYEIAYGVPEDSVKAVVDTTAKKPVITQPVVQPGVKEKIAEKQTAKKATANKVKPVAPTEVERTNLDRMQVAPDLSTIMPNYGTYQNARDLLEQTTGTTMTPEEFTQWGVDEAATGLAPTKAAPTKDEAMRRAGYTRAGRALRNLSDDYSNPLTGLMFGNTQNPGGLIGGVAEAMPSIYNLIRGAQEPELAEYTPNSAGLKAAANMQNLKYNINPAITQAQRAYNASRSNLASRSRGEQMAGTSSLQGALSGALSNLYAQKANMENQYKAQGNQMMASVGAQNAASQQQANQFNAMNRAAGTNMVGAGLTGLSNLYQQRRQDTQQRGMDKYKFDIMMNMFGGMDNTAFGRMMAEMANNFGYTKRG